MYVQAVRGSKHVDQSQLAISTFIKKWQFILALLRLDVGL